MTKEINPDKFGGPYTMIEGDADREAYFRMKRSNERFILEQIIEDDDDPVAVEIAKAKLAELDAAG